MTDPHRTEPEIVSEAGELVRPYVITRGRDLPDEDEFALITLVTASTDEQQRPQRLSPEEQQILEMCSSGYLSVAEIAAHSQLPLGVVKVLLSSLAEGGYLVTRAPVPSARLATKSLLQEVLDGLKALSV
jgi:DNA-directed RNA polymerase specialized sigma24 family protein